MTQNLSNCLKTKYIEELNNRLENISFPLGSELDEIFLKLITLATTPAPFDVCDADDIQASPLDGETRFLCVTDRTCTFVEKEDIIQLYETLTKLELDAVTCDLVYTDETGTANTVASLAGYVTGASFSAACELQFTNKLGANVGAAFDFSVLEQTLTLNATTCAVELTGKDGLVKDSVVIPDQSLGLNATTCAVELTDKKGVLKDSIVIPDQSLALNATTCAVELSDKKGVLKDSVIIPDQSLALNATTCAVELSDKKGVLKDSIVIPDQVLSLDTTNAGQCDLILSDKKGVALNTIDLSFSEQDLTLNATTCAIELSGKDGLIKDSVLLPPQVLSLDSTNPGQCDLILSDYKGVAQNTIDLSFTEQILSLNGTTCNIELTGKDGAIKDSIALPPQVLSLDTTNPGQCDLILSDYKGVAQNTIDLSFNEQDLTLNATTCAIELSGKDGALKDSIVIPDQRISLNTTAAGQCDLELTDKKGVVLDSIDLSFSEQTLAEVLDADGCLTNVTITGKDGAVKDTIDLSKIDVCSLKNGSGLITGLALNSDCELELTGKGGTAAGVIDLTDIDVCKLEPVKSQDLTALPTFPATSKRFEICIDEAKVSYVQEKDFVDSYEAWHDGTSPTFNNTIATVVGMDQERYTRPWASLASGEVALSAGYLYEVQFHFSGDMVANDSRTTLGHNIRINGTGAAENSFRSYHRENPNGDSTATKKIIIEAAAATTVGLETIRFNGTGTVDVVDGETSVVVTRVRSL